VPVGAEAAAVARCRPGVPWPARQCKSCGLTQGPAGDAGQPSRFPRLSSSAAGAPSRAKITGAGDVGALTLRPAATVAPVSTPRWSRCLRPTAAPAPASAPSVSSAQGGAVASTPAAQRAAWRTGRGGGGLHLRRGEPRCVGGEAIAAAGTSGRKRPSRVRVRALRRIGLGWGPEGERGGLAKATEGAGTGEEGRR
jgi:hypothetical protein